jgi:septal ring factor EnvC (AmiA/AmiB activator)
MSGSRLTDNEGRPVVRFFPRTTRRRVAAALAASSMVLGTAAVPLASADDLKHRKHEVQGHIHKARKELDQSSHDLVRASRALDRAESRLQDAQSELSAARGELAAAEILDQRMQAELDAAVKALQDARSRLADGVQEVHDQRTQLGRMAVQNYQLGGPQMLGLSMVLTSTDPAELTGQLNSVRNVLDKEATILDRLKASKVLLQVQKEKVQAAKQVVAVKRRQAAENLERKQQLEAKAEAAEAKVSELVDARERARSVAAKAKAADAKRLRQLERERAKITTMLKKRAAAARRAAARERARARAHHQPPPSSGGHGNRGGYLSYPIDTYITSSYGMRMHPVYHRWTLHDGTDFGAGMSPPRRSALPTVRTVSSGSSSPNSQAREAPVGSSADPVRWSWWSPGPAASSWANTRRSAVSPSRRRARGVSRSPSSRRATKP